MMLTFLNDMAEINEARNEMRVKCPMCPWVLISLASLTCAGMSGYRGGWKTSVGRGRCKGSSEKGAHEQTMMRSWMNAWAAWSGARRGDGCSESFEVMRRSVEVGAEEPTEVMSGMTMLAIDEACVSDGCGARRMQLGRWWGWWRCWLRRWLWRDSESPGGKVESQWWWRSTSSSESCQQTV